MSVGGRAGSRARMGGDLLADGFRPRRATELFKGDHIARQSQSADELAGAFHGRQDLDFIT